MTPAKRLLLWAATPFRYLGRKWAEADAYWAGQGADLGRKEDRDE